MTITRVVLSELVEDWDLYPRHAVDSSHVSDLARAIRAGDGLPPLRVEAGTNRIVDGFHRARAYRKVFGDTAEVDVDVRSYTDETEVVKDAIRLNAAHGRKLDSQDRTKSILMLDRRGVPTVEIAATLHIPETRVQELKLRIVIVDDNGNSETRPAKPVLRSRDPNTPRRVTRQQYETHTSSQGWRPSQVIGQLIREIREKVVDLNDPALCGKLWELHDEIERQVPRPEQRTA